MKGTCLVTPFGGHFLGHFLLFGTILVNHADPINRSAMLCAYFDTFLDIDALPEKDITKSNHNLQILSIVEDTVPAMLCAYLDTFLYIDAMSE